MVINFTIKSDFTSLLTKLLIKRRMSISNMVADNSKKREYIQGQPMFDSTKVVNWAKKLKTWLMRKKRNHLGLEAPPVRPPNNAAAVVRAEYKKDIEEWLERNDTCVSAIYETVQHVPRPVAKRLHQDCLNPGLPVI